MRPQYEKIEIHGVDDLPKEEGKYIAYNHRFDDVARIKYFVVSKNDWLQNIDWYLIADKETIESEKYPVIAIDDIDVETVKRWFQLFMGFSDDSKMKEDIKAMARASDLNRHLNWEQPDKPSDGKSAPLWYTKQEMKDWLIHNNYSREIAEELSEKWASDLQGAFQKGWDKLGYEFASQLKPGEPQGKSEKSKDNYCHCKYPLFCPICGKEFLPEIESDNNWLKKMLTAYSEYVKEQSEDCSTSITIDDFIKIITNKNKS